MSTRAPAAATRTLVRSRRAWARSLRARALARLRATPRPLALVLLTGALLSLGWDLAVPAFQGPDETTQFAYVQFLAENGRLPTVQRGGASTEAEDALQWLNLRPLIGDAPARPAWTGADLANYRRIERAMPKGSRANGNGENTLAKNPPLYYAVMAVPYRIFLWLPLLKRIFVMRLFNALFYLATIVLVWLLAGELFGPGARFRQLLAAGAVALEPQLAFMSAMINTDTLLVTLTTAVLLASVRLVRLGPSPGRVLGASLLTVAALLTHGRGLVTVPVLATALVASLVSHRTPLREAARRTGMAAATIAAAFVAYVLFGRSGRGGIYGGQVSQLNSGTSFNLRQFVSSVYQFYFPRLPSMQARIGPEYGYRQVYIDTFYGTFGSLEVTFKARVYDVLQVVSALGLVGFWTAAVARARRLLAAWPVVLTLLSLLIATVFFLHYVSYRSLLGNGGTDPLIVGRYLLPMISLFGLAIAFTVGALPRRAAWLLGALILAGGILLSLTGLGITAGRFYA